jgi:preprotein translocase subunit SecA
VVEAVRACQATGQPVLVGTPSVANSEHLSALLTRAGLAHRVLNASQDADEAAIVAAAGQRGRITVATNMAGRGTDIALGPGVGELGGLHVILTECHESRRVDRQLIGRCARQGDPGSVQALLSLEDETVALFLPAGLLCLYRFLGRGGHVLPFWAGAVPTRWTQRKLERAHARARRRLLKTDRRLADTLAFAGRSE